MGCFWFVFRVFICLVVLFGGFFVCGLIWLISSKLMLLGLVISSDYFCWVTRGRLSWMFTIGCCFCTLHVLGCLFSAFAYGCELPGGVYI